MSNYKVWEFHPAMIFKKYKCCPKCGEKLVKEKYKRIVTKDDEDFYEYYKSTRGHMHGVALPIGNIEVDVVTTRYACPACNKSYTYDELRECVKANKNNKK
ncbi:MAG: hypothetical protein K2O39_05665 [Clostridiales bacterium]|nr:hypothetical protein [Clostridiales bacterium]